MTPATDPGRAAEEMREALANVILDALIEWQAVTTGTTQASSVADAVADALLAGPLAQLRARLHEAEKDREAVPPVIEFHQQDWIPGFAAFLPGATTPQPDSRAFCVLNLGSMLSTVAHGDVPASDLPAFIVESMIHEVGHVMEQWAGVEFSEERVEALCDRYRAALTPAPEENQEAGDV